MNSLESLNGLSPRSTRSTNSTNSTNTMTNMPNSTNTTNGKVPITLAQLMKELSSRPEKSMSPIQATVDQQLINMMEGPAPKPQVVAIEDTNQVDENEQHVEDIFDDATLFSDAELAKAADLPTEEEYTRVIEEDTKAGLQRVEDPKYITIGSEDVVSSEIVQEERPKRSRTPSKKVEEVLLQLEERREMKRILEERELHKKESQEQREELKRRKQGKIDEMCQALPVSESIAVARKLNNSSRYSIQTTATELGTTRQECIETQTLLSRAQYTESGSDFSMMRFLHCPETPSNVVDVGNRDDCLCWLCGYPMMTKEPYASETIMIKPVHGQVSPEHTFPVMAGNSLIGLPTKEFIKRYEHDQAYMKYAINFLKKGLTYSHFWCNEVKNALRLVTWPNKQLPQPNDANIRWLLNAMWYGTNRANRWFDRNTCFVIYKKGDTSYKFYNLVHYFTLRADDWQGMPSTERINARGKEWIESRFSAIKNYVQDICKDIETFTKRINTDARTIEELSNTLKQIYKDKVINGSKSAYEWPPNPRAVIAKPKTLRLSNAKTKKLQLKANATGPRSSSEKKKPGKPSTRRRNLNIV